MTTPADGAMRLGLRLISRVAGSRLIDRLGLRAATERALFRGARAGFGSAGAVGRGFKAMTRLAQPLRPERAHDSGLFDLTPTDAQLMLRDAVLDFAREQVRPAAQAADAACATPPELLRASAELGISQLGMPEAFGGTGGERAAMTNALVAEALAQGDLGVAVACLAPSAVATALVLWGDEEQQARYLPAFADGQAPAAALAVLEPDPLFDATRLKSRARTTAHGYELSGVKSLVPRGAACELLIVAADLEGQGPALFLVESAGTTLRAEAEPAMGLRAAATARLHFDRLQLPREALLGGANPATYHAMLGLARLGWCALSVGAAQAALEYLIPYVNERVAFGEPISHRQAVAFAIADIAIELEGMRLLTWRAASRAERGEPFVEQAALARRLCADKGMRIGSEAVQLLGGHGFVKEHPAERWYRDLRACGLMEGVLLI
jgi:alkylation response protein AidB-like acyl-CoA dehydrogenase